MCMWREAREHTPHGGTCGRPTSIVDDGFLMARHTCHVAVSAKSEATVRVPKDGDADDARRQNYDFRAA